MQCLVIRLLGAEERDGQVLKTVLQSFATYRQAPDLPDGSKENCLRSICPYYFQCPVNTPKVSIQRKSVNYLLYPTATLISQRELNLNYNQSCC